MGFLDPRVEQGPPPQHAKVPVSSQATPLAMSVLDVLRRQVAGGQMGAGLGPLQREAGTAIRQFVESGGGRFDTSELFKNLRTQFERGLERQAANLRESFGIAGSRFGSPLSTSEALMRSEAETGFAATTGEIARQEFANQMDRFLRGIAMMQEFGTQNLSPFLALASTGILPEQILTGDTIVRDNPFVSGFKLFTGLLDSIMPDSIIGFGGGGGGNG